MANRFTYSKQIFTPEGQETFTAVECASFDEAKKMVDAGVRDRLIELEQKYPERTSRPGGTALQSAINHVVQLKNAPVNKSASDPVLPPALGASAAGKEDEGGKGSENTQP